MTGIEYNAKLDRLHRRSLFGGMIAELIGAWLWGWYVIRHAATISKEPAYISIGGLLLSCLIPAALVFLTFWQLQKRLRVRHPEMKYLEEWKNVMGTYEGYPTDGHGTTPLVTEAAAKLERAARSAKAAFAARESVRHMVREHDPNSTEHAVLEHLCGMLSNCADDMNRSFLKQWDLFVRYLGVLTDQQYSNPVNYRASLSKNK